MKNKIAEHISWWLGVALRTLFDVKNMEVEKNTISFKGGRKKYKITIEEI